MIRINEVKAGNAVIVLGFGMSMTGTVVAVDAATESFTYISDDASEQDTINLRCIGNSKVPGNRYDVHKCGDVVVANFRSWQSGKYYEC